MGDWRSSGKVAQLRTNGSCLEVLQFACLKRHDGMREGAGGRKSLLERERDVRLPVFFGHSHAFWCHLANQFYVKIGGSDKPCEFRFSRLQTFRSLARFSRYSCKSVKVHIWTNSFELETEVESSKHEKHPNSSQILLYWNPSLSGVAIARFFCVQ